VKLGFNILFGIVKIGDVGDVERCGLLDSQTTRKVSASMMTAAPDFPVALRDKLSRNAARSRGVTGLE
jgi:hypothetical protein